MEFSSNQKSLLDRPAFARVNWEQILLAGLIAVTILTRLWDLSYRAWNHDEAIHTHWSWTLYTGRGYQHNPIYHGPFLYHFTALTFFLFGDNDVSARLAPALFGIVLVALPYFFRRWLGKRGWLATAAMLLISPSILYYSRFNRHDVYVELFTILMALAIWKYFDERKEMWLIATAALLAFSFTAMETTFIFVAVFAEFLCAHFTFEYVRARVNWSNFNVGLFAAILGIPFFGFLVGVNALRSAAGKTSSGNWRAIPSFNLAMIFGTFSLPLLTPVLLYGLNLIWKSAFNTDFFPINAFTEISVLTQIAQTQFDVALRIIGLTGAMILLAALVGIWWNARVWTISALLFWPIFVVFFTTIFTNGGGFFTGLLGSLGYWLSQQEVQRGGQPSYYYLFVTLPMYEVLPYVVGIATMIWYWWRHRPARLLLILTWILISIIAYILLRPLFVDSPLAKIGDLIVYAGNAVVVALTFFATYDRERAETFFPTFIFTWAVGCLVIFSLAGEKMPWLTMHLAIPLSFVAGWAIDKLLDADWRDMFARGAVWLALLIPFTLVLIAMLLFGARPFQGVSLEQLSATNGFIVTAILLMFFAGPVLYYIGRRFTQNEITRIATVTFVIVLAALTIRFAWLAVYINPDNAVETIIYAQGSHDDPIAMQEIDDLSRRLCGHNTPGKVTTGLCENGKIKVAYDDDTSWPFVWYLRNYTNAQFYGASPGAPFDAAVVLVGSKNEEAVKPFLGNKYLKRTYKLIWWPLEGYKDLSLERVLDYIRDPQMRADLFTAWFYHRYKEQASQWPYVHNFTLNVRKDVAAMLWDYAGQLPPQPTVDDEYEKKFVRLTAARVIGSAGTGAGQLQNPKNVAVDAQGNLFVADSDNGRIQKFDANGKFLSAFGSKSAPNAIGAPGTLAEPWGIAVDQTGNVYVADTWNHRIQKFDAAGKLVTLWGTNGDTRGVARVDPTSFYGPRAIAIDAQGNLLVSDTGNKRVLKFDAYGKPLDQYGGVGAGEGQFLEQVGIAIDQQGNIFVADTWNLRIQKFDSNFNFVMQWSVQAWDSQSVVNKPYIAIDPDGNVFVTDPEISRILKFSNDGKLLAVFGGRGSDLASFNLPTGLAFDAQGNLYVADSGNNRVLVFAKP
jgi:predicted membrane-bound mannosyltransferase/DNA-binding beta-propeller fold protein YncE